MFLIFLTHLLWVVLLCSCALFPNNSASPEPLEDRNAELENPEAKVLESILEDESLPVKDVLEEGFCYDDIYATYLRKKYYNEQKRLVNLDENLPIIQKFNQKNDVCVYVGSKQFPIIQKKINKGTLKDANDIILCFLSILDLPFKFNISASQVKV